MVRFKALFGKRRKVSRDSCSSWADVVFHWDMAGSPSHGVLEMFWKSPSTAASGLVRIYRIGGNGIRSSTHAQAPQAEDRGSRKSGRERCITVNWGLCVHPGPRRRENEDPTYCSSPCLSRASNRGMMGYQDVLK